VQSPSAMRLFRTAAIGSALAAALPAHAATPDCSVNGNTFLCRLSEFLNLLYVAATILTLVLIVVIVLAVRIYRSNKNPEDQQ